ncbi:hypothetical protein SAMN04489743_2857 [Pseudarthrobacter equi]|uniref:Uncharacterized protein n=1 Tax=Pseudarthrobacter equi TaxID=728066 RepID=A0A1H2A9F9_9MICC|nr:hypothetical protein [Pseudarthrobacter equi]SDT42507.1 hypothetical protein SAMN04489743_2857 [Pseudarthrobacter equi]
MKLVYVCVAVVICGGLALLAGFFATETTRLAVAGAVIAASGKFGELLAKSSTIKNSPGDVKDGFSLFTEGMTFFGVLLTTLGAVFALSAK